MTHFPSPGQRREEEERFKLILEEFEFRLVCAFYLFFGLNS